MTITITRKGRWVVADDQHNEVHEAFQNAARRAEEAPGTVVKVTPPAYDVIFEAEFEPPVDPPPTDPPTDPPAADTLLFENVTGAMLGDVPNVHWKFDALFHDFTGDGRYGLFVFSHGQPQTSRLWQNTGVHFELVDNELAHYHIAEPEFPRGSGWLTLLDVNGDGKQDFWTWDADALSAWYENGSVGGSPTFAAKHDGSHDHTVFGDILGLGRLQKIDQSRAIRDPVTDELLVPGTERRSDHVVGDVTGTTWPDIVAPGAGGYWRNDAGELVWVEVPGLACAEQNIVLADFANSGYLDILCWDGSGARLWINNGDGTFIESADTGLGTVRWNTWWSEYGNVIAADLGNNGLQDLLFAGENYGSTVVVYRNLGGYRFERLELDFGQSETSGDQGKPRCAVADYDNDGLLDIVKTQTGTNIGLWRNTTTTDNHWLKVRCRGPGHNTDGLGCDVKIYAAGTNELISHVAVQASHQHPQTWLHLGAAAHEHVDLVVAFPNGAGTFTFPGIAADQEAIVYSTGDIIQGWLPGNGWPLEYEGEDAPPEEPPPEFPSGLTIDMADYAASGPRFEQFQAFVDRAVAGNPGYLFRATDAAVAAQMVDTPAAPSYELLAIETAAAVAREARVVAEAGEVPKAGHDSYYFAGGEIVPIAVVYAWFRNSLTEQEAADIEWYCDTTAWNIWHHADAAWAGNPHPWSGWATDKPANNYFYNFTITTMAWALASGEPLWLDKVRNELLPTLKAYFETIPSGGSHEGTGYGLSHSRAFELLQLWKDTTGEDWTTAHVEASIAYWIGATTPDFKHAAVIGDQARVSDGPIWDYHRLLMLRARHLTPDIHQQNLATWWLRRVPELVDDAFNARGNLLPPGDTEAVPPLVYHAADVGHLFARSGHGMDALWFNFVAGPYIEDHMAQEQGGFTLYKAGWLAVTPNIWSHSGIHQGTEGRNVLRFEQNGTVIEQRYWPHDSPQAIMYDVLTTNETGSVIAGADLTPAYKDQPAVEQWGRIVDFNASAQVLDVHDTLVCGDDTEAIWQLHVPDEPTVEGNIVTTAGLRVEVLEPAAPTITTHNLADGEFSRGWRIEVRGGSDQYRVTITVIGNGVPS